MNERFTLPPLSRDTSVAGYVRGRVVALRHSLARRLGTPYQIEFKSEPSASDELRGVIRYVLTVRSGSTAGADVMVSIVEVEPGEASSSAGHKAQEASVDEESATKRQARLWFQARSAARLTDRIDRMIVKLGCVMLFVFTLIATVVALFPGSVEDAWNRYFQWLAAVVLSYAILLAVVGPVPKRLLRLLPRNRDLLATIEDVAGHVLTPQEPVPPNGTSVSEPAE